MNEKQILELAPEWATHYQIKSDRLVGFYNYLTYQLLSWGVDGWVSLQVHHGAVNLNGKVELKSIEREPFDISNYKFNDLNVYDSSVRGDFVDIELYHEYNILSLSERDAIALAKHFNLTAEDLK